MGAFELKMPKLGESVTEGTIGKWLKQPGEQVSKYDLLVEVQTDKVNTEIPSPVAGTLKEIRVQEGETVPIGALLAVFETEGATVDAAAPGAPSATRDEAAPGTPSAEPRAVPGSVDQRANAATVPPPASPGAARPAERPRPEESRT